MDKARLDLRRAHALQELQMRGVIKGKKLPWLSRLLFKIRPKTKPMYYGDYGLYGVILGVGFAIPFVLMIGGAFYMEEDIPVWPGVLIGLAAGVMFGGFMAYWMRTTHQGANLSAWDDLDTPPVEDEEAAAAYAEMEDALISRAGRMTMGAARKRD